MKFKEGDTVWVEYLPLIAEKGVVLKYKTWLFGLIRRYKVSLLTQGPEGQHYAYEWVREDCLIPRSV